MPFKGHRPNDAIKRFLLPTLINIIVALLKQNMIIR